MQRFLVNAAVLHETRKSTNPKPMASQPTYLSFHIFLSIYMLMQHFKLCFVNIDIISELNPNSCAWWTAFKNSRFHLKLSSDSERDTAMESRNRARRLGHITFVINVCFSNLFFFFYYLFKQNPSPISWISVYLALWWNSIVRLGSQKILLIAKRQEIFSTKEIHDHLLLPVLFHHHYLKEKKKKKSLAG